MARQLAGAGAVIDADRADIGAAVDVHDDEGQFAPHRRLDELGLLDAAQDEAVDHRVANGPGPLAVLCGYQRQSDAPFFADFRHPLQEFAHIGIREDPGIAGIGGGNDADGVGFSRAQEPAPRIRAGVADFARYRLDMGTQCGAYALRPAEDVPDRGLRNPRHLGDVEQGHHNRHSDSSPSLPAAASAEAPHQQRMSAECRVPRSGDAERDFTGQRVSDGRHALAGGPACKLGFDR